MKTPYTGLWYTSHQGFARSSASVVVPAIMELVNPRSVVDVGCGIGEWLSAFRHCGVASCVGLDGAHIDRDQLRIPVENFVPVDLTNPPTLSGSYDLAVCLEVAEHLPEKSGEALVNWLTRVAPAVLFSAAIPLQRGEQHVNEQWPDYWQSLFERRGYLAIDCLRDRFWDDPRVAWYYSQNIVLYIARNQLDRYPKMREYVSAFDRPLRKLVHPARYLQTADVYSFSLGEILRALPPLASRSVRYRWYRWMRRVPPKEAARLAGYPHPTAF